MMGNGIEVARGSVWWDEAASRVFEAFADPAAASPLGGACFRMPLFKRGAVGEDGEHAQEGARPASLGSFLVAHAIVLLKPVEERRGGRVHIELL